MKHKNGYCNFLFSDEKEVLSFIEPRVNDGEDATIYSENVYNPETDKMEKHYFVLVKATVLRKLQTILGDTDFDDLKEEIRSYQNICCTQSEVAKILMKKYKANDFEVNQMFKKAGMNVPKEYSSLTDWRNDDFSVKKEVWKPKQPSEFASYMHNFSLGKMENSGGTDLFKV